MVNILLFLICIVMNYVTYKYYEHKVYRVEEKIIYNIQSSNKTQKTLNFIKKHLICQMIDKVFLLLQKI